MKLLQELRHLLESKHGDTWFEKFRLARDATNTPIPAQEDIFYYKHRTYKSNKFDVWYFAAHQPSGSDGPMDIAALHDDPEIQAKLRAKSAPVPERIDEIETFVVFQQNHSYAMWDDWEGRGMVAMIDWKDREVGSRFDSPMRELAEKLDDPNTVTDDDVLKYVDLVKEAYNE